MSSHDRDDHVVVTVMSLSLLLLSPPRASKMLFSHNTPATMRRIYAEKRRTKAEGRTCVSGLSRADGKRYRYTHPRKQPTYVYKDDAASAEVREHCQLSLSVESGPLYWSFFFFVDEIEKTQQVFSQSASVLYRVPGASRNGYLVEIFFFFFSREPASLSPEGMQCIWKYLILGI